MSGKNYFYFSAEDFASDTYFQRWILENDHMTNLFWEKWLVDNPKKRTDIDLAKKIIGQLTFKEYITSSEDFNEVWKNIKETHTGMENPVEPSRKKWYVGTAAAIVILISSAFFFNRESSNFNKNDAQIVSPVIINNSIETGTDKAILTLANGSDITLIKGETYKTQNASSDGKEIVYNAITASEKIAYNYLTTPRGGQFFVKLSDGTQVWLNSESRLKYPVTFLDGEIRQVELVYGEAYFDVSPSTKHNDTKFKVINQAQEVEVLGTEFNIKAYKDESNLYTTLIEGEVVVSILNRDEILTPNQQLKLDLTNNNTVVSIVDVYRETSWKKGVFSFKNKSLKDIMKVLSRWYEIDVIFNNKELESTIFSGTLKKKLSIIDVLETISSANNINYEINNKTVLLK
jgi:hypothetical protein